MKRYAIPIKILLGFIAVMALGVLLLAWRLSIGPIALDWTGDYLRTALTSEKDDLSIDFRDAVLIWRSANTQNLGRSSGLQINFYEVEIKDKTTNFGLKIPEAGVRFSGLAMLRGLVAPTDVEFSGLAIDYAIDPEIWQSTDNRPFVEKLESLIRSLQQSDNILVKLSQRLLSKPSSSEVTGYLQQISLLNTGITVLDELSGQIWKIPSADLSLRRTEKGLMINLFGDIALSPENMMPLDMSLLYDNEKKAAVTIIEFSGLRPSALAGKVESLARIRNFDIPASGTIEFSVDKTVTIPVMRFNLALGEGEVNPNNLYKEPLKISSASLNGYIQKDENTVILEEISLALGTTVIEGSGLLYGSLEQPGVTLTANIKKLPFIDLKSYWPGEFGKGAYLWILKNVEAGIVPHGLLKIQVTPEMWSLEELPATSATFTFDFDNISTHYLRPMPLLTNMSGQAELNLHEFRLKSNNGRIDDLAISKANLLFTDIHKKGGATAFITLDMAGALEEVLRVIDHKPLGYPSRYGIKQGSIQGKTTATVKLEFPLVRDIKLDEVIFDIQAHVTDLTIPALSESLRLTEGVMDLHVDGDSLTSNGTIRLNDIDFSAEWQEDFDKLAAFPSHYSIRGIVEGAGWNQLKLPFDPYIEGPVEIYLSLLGKGGALRKGEGNFDFSHSRSIFGPLGWDKPVNEPGSAAFKLNFTAPGEITISDLKLRSNTLNADLELDLKDEWVTRLAVPTLVMKNTNMTMTMNWNPEEKKYLSSLSGTAMDGVPFIDLITGPDTKGEKITLPDFDLSADLKNIKAKNDIQLKTMTLSAQYRDQNFTHVSLSGTQSTNQELHITVEPKGENRALMFASKDAGEALRGFGLFNIGVGGDMVLTADMVTHEHGVSLGGHAYIKDFKVIESPEFSKLLEEKKFAKAQEELKKGGLTFSSFDMDFRQYNGIMEITKGRARGPMLGMTIDGSVDQSYNELSIKGTLIPAYGINSLLSNIPLIGTILTGGKGQGIFAATYSIKGSLDKPEIRINPLAALAPGILRSIFSAMGSSKEKTLREKAEALEKLTPNTAPESKR